MIAEPCVAGNPVLSIVQSDIIVYNQNLRNYFIDEFLRPEYENEIVTDMNIDEVYRKIPFWGELMFRNES